MLMINPLAHAIPIGDMEIVYIKTLDNHFRYFFVVENVGPPLNTPVSTPPDYFIFGNPNYPAGSKPLDDDEYITLFGLDTRRDDVVISNITNAGTDFSGSASTGFADSDNDGIPNQIIGFHLPDVFTLDQALAVNETAGVFSFEIDQEVNEFEFWVGGSDDTLIYDPTGQMLHDAYGLYDVEEETYLATFYTQRLNARRVNIAELLHFLGEHQ